MKTLLQLLIIITEKTIWLNDVKEKVLMNLLNAMNLLITI